MTSYGDAGAIALIEALFRVAWAIDRIYAVRLTVKGRPREVIDAVLSDWVLWWGAGGTKGCRYGRVALALGALDKEEHDHLDRLVKAMLADAGEGKGCHCTSTHSVLAPQAERRTVPLR